MGRIHITPRRLMFCLLGLSVVLFAVVGLARAGGDPLLNTPPPKPVRIPAEFEPMQAVVANWLADADGDLYRYLAEDTKLVMLWESANVYELIQSSLSNYGVNMGNCEFYQVSNVPIMRDALPWLLFADQNKAAFVHNEPATDYWAIPPYGLTQGYTIYRSGLTVQGGDFMTDGQGTAASLDDTAIRHAAMGDGFMERVRDYWGVQTYFFVPDENDKYFHIDCMAKFLSPDTVMVLRTPSSHDRHECLEGAAAYFRKQVSCYGTPYNVVRVDARKDEPYTNSLIVNRRVFVPIVDGQADANALASYEAAMPGYEVIGVRNCYPGTNNTVWSSGIALHCMTMGIADEQMLYIEHTPLLDRPPASQGFPISARIVAHSKTEFVEGTPVVLWRTVTDANEAQPPESWNSLPMSRQSEFGEHQYLAYIPAQPVGTVIQYYLRARDASGRDETHPYIGEPQAHTFTATTLGANVSAISAQRGGTVEVYMNAGLDNAQQSYRLSYSLSADTELLENPQAALPDTTVFTGFNGQLDDAGIGAARMTLVGPLTSDWVGTRILFSLELTDQQNDIPDTVSIQILE
ncbi:MAG: agmatine deiminase family protein [Phycisphaerales bacterium]